MSLTWFMIGAAIGWAIGIERVALALDEPERQPEVDVFIVAEGDSRDRALALATELRRAGVAADLDLAERSQKGQMKQADRSGAARTLILEGDGATLREMESGEQRAVDPARVVQELTAS